MIKKLLSTLVLPVSTILMGGCGNLGGDSSYIVEARSAARSPGLTGVQRGRIFEDAGDTAVAQGRRGYADEMYFEAALAYDMVAPPARLALLQRIYSKCVGIGMAQGPGCQEVPSMISDRQSVGSGAPAPAQSLAGPAYTVPGRTGPGTGGAVNSPSPGQPSPSATGQPDLEAAIRQARAKRAGVSAMIDGCPTGVGHLAADLPICPANRQLSQFRELLLETDASFVEDQAAGYSLRQIAAIQAQAARQYEDALRQAERAMMEASADGALARARLSALRETPPRCDAGPQGSFGMGESSYQAYVSSMMVARTTRAVSALAACRARAKP